MIEDQFQSFVHVFRGPGFVFGWTNSIHINQNIPNFLVLIVSEVVVSPLEIQYGQILVYVLDEWWIKLDFEGTCCPQEINFLVEGETVFWERLKFVVDLLEKLLS